MTSAGAAFCYVSGEGHIEIALVEWKNEPTVSGEIRQVPPAVAEPPWGSVALMDLLLPLAEDVCHLWWAHLSELRDEHQRLLAHADRTRRERLSDSADRQRLTLGVAVTRLVLGEYLETSPAGLVIDRTCVHCGEQHGKPQLLTAPDLQFSITHSDSWVAVAVLLHRPVGVDVEEISRFAHAELEDLADEILSVDERTEFVRHSADERNRVLAAYWTRKEAVVKATGQGLQTCLRDVILPPPELAGVVRWGSDDKLSPLHVRSLAAPEGFAAALAALGGAPVRVVEHRATELLQQQRSWRS